MINRTLVEENDSIYNLEHMLIVKTKTSVKSKILC